jgi:hypothetical protein
MSAGQRGRRAMQVQYPVHAENLARSLDDEHGANVNVNSVAHVGLLLPHSVPQSLRQRGQSHGLSNGTAVFDSGQAILSALVPTRAVWSARCGAAGCEIVSSLRSPSSSAPVAATFLLE